MNYKGKLYGKIAGKYFDTGVTSEDYDRLTDWKESMMKVHNELDLQGIGKALGLPLGSSIAPQVLPKVKVLIEQNTELVEMLERAKLEFEQFRDAFGQGSLLINEIEKLILKHDKQ